jgi:hypothetical protein
LPFVNGQIKYGYKKLNKYLHRVVSGSYVINCAQPSISFTPGTSKINMSFSISGTFNGGSISTATATITAAPGTAYVDGGIALVLNWDQPKLSVTGFNGNTTHIEYVRTMIDNNLNHSIYLAPATYKGTVFPIPPPLNGNISCETILKPIVITSSSSLVIELYTSWFVN